MTAPLKVTLKNDFQFNMIKNALFWWNKNSTAMINTHLYKSDLKNTKSFVQNMLNNMNTKTKIPYKLVFRNISNEIDFVTVLSDYLKHNKNIRKASNQVAFKAISNIAVYGFKDLQIRYIINTTK